MLPQKIKRKMEAMALAKKYNNITGSTITHKDIDEWGYLEVAEIEHAINFFGLI